MISKFVSSDRLAPILILDKMYEVTPLPHRMQSNLELVITVPEYMEFCEWLQGADCLSERTYILVNDISKYRLKLDMSSILLHFQRDVALAQIKELMYACEYGKGATKITPQFDGSEIKLPLSKIGSKWFEEMEDSVRDIDAYLKQRCYSCTLSDIYAEDYLREYLKISVHSYSLSSMGIVGVFI